MPGWARTGRLTRFRGRRHGCFERRADALFELCDAVLVAGPELARLETRLYEVDHVSVVEASE